MKVLAQVKVIGHVDCPARKRRVSLFECLYMCEDFSDTEFDESEEEMYVSCLYDV